MLYHNVLNSSKHKLGIQTVQGQRAQNQQNAFYKNMRTIAEVLNIKLEAAVAVNESEMENKTKLKTVREDEL